MKKVYKVINCSTTVHEDSYEKGEGKFVNCWSLREVAPVIELTDYNNVKELLEAINEKYLYHRGKKDEGVKNWFIYEDPDLAKKGEIRFDTDQLVNVDNQEARDYEVEAWKKNEKELYNAHTVLYVKAIMVEDVNYDEMLKDAQEIGLELC
jgi:hypothetical protein